MAIQRLLVLGLDRDSQVISRCVAFMLDVLAGRQTWSDPPEKHEGWPVNIKFITAGTLAKIDSGHPALQESIRKWVEIVERTFLPGSYDEGAERQAHRDVNSIRTKGKYLKLASQYPLWLLTSGGAHLSARTEKLYLDWIWNKPDGIYYVYGSCLASTPDILSKEFTSWLDALELFSRFPAGWAYVRSAINWMWEQRDRDGLWDFGPHARASIYFPLSDSWKKSLDRKVDCTVRVLSFLRKIADPMA